MVFINKMNETFHKYSFVCYAYCLMNNHYHLFLKTPLANVSDGMHYLNSSYANWFKTRHRIVGVVFQGRYKSILVDIDSYALELSAYTHLNPRRGGLVRSVQEYKWSSFLDYVGTREPLIDHLDISLILGMFDDNPATAREQYRTFVLDRAGMKDPLEKAYRGLVLGSEDFVEKIKERMRSVGRIREIPETRHVQSYSAEEIISEISKVSNMRREELLHKRRGNIHRQLALYLMKRYSPLSLREIGELFDMDYAAVSQATRRFERKIESETEVRDLEDLAIRHLGNVKC